MPARPWWSVTLTLNLKVMFQRNNSFNNAHINIENGESSHSFWSFSSTLPKYFTLFYSLGTLLQKKAVMLFSAFINVVRSFASRKVLLVCFSLILSHEHGRKNNCHYVKFVSFAGSGALLTLQLFSELRHWRQCDSCFVWWDKILQDVYSCYLVSLGELLGHADSCCVNLNNKDLRVIGGE